MRRLLAITITLLLSFTLAAPLFAIDSNSNLPECCRRTGRHHCDGSMTSSADRSFTSIGSRCPAFPKATAAPTLHNFTPAVPRNVATPLFVHPCAPPQTEARYRIASARSRQKRGPPAALIAS